MTGEVFERLPNEEREATIPPATLDDLFDAAFDPKDDDKHRFRWLTLAEEQPAIAQELHESISFLVSDVRVRGLVMNEFSLMYSALNRAAERKHQREDTDLDPVA